MARTWIKRLLPCGAASALPGCAGNLSALQPRGPVADAIAQLWWVMFWGAAAVFVLVLALLAYAVFRAPGRRARIDGTAMILVGGLVFPALVVAALLVYGTDVGRRIVLETGEPLVIEVTGHQWWWEFRYPATDGAPEVVTANELHVPVGVPLKFSLESADVVHSFWIPSLSGKVDAVPGRVNVLRMEASVPGQYLGQCAELCGAQHAHMKFTVTAESPEAFAAWREARGAPAAHAGAGFDAFVDAGCAECHTLRGTAADGTAGPDLTHVGARPTLGATGVTNEPGALRRWVARHGWDVKPGNLGPEPERLDPALADELADFLERQR